jgi:hypothetical protein
MVGNWGSAIPEGNLIGSLLLSWYVAASEPTTRPIARSIAVIGFRFSRCGSQTTAEPGRR